MEQQIERVTATCCRAIESYLGPNHDVLFGVIATLIGLTAIMLLRNKPR